MELGIFGLDLLVLLSVLFEFCSSSARSLELFNSVAKLCEERIKIFLALGDKMTEDLSDESVSMVNKVILHLGRVKDDELLVLLNSFQSDIINNVLQILNTLFISSNRVILWGIKRDLEETVLASLCTQTGYVTDLRRELPQLAVFVHLLLHVIHDLSDLL